MLLDGRNAAARASPLPEAGGAREDERVRGPSGMDTAFAAQRRQLTVMFCDLVGSTELSTRLDPEDMHDLIGAYHRACTEAIERAGGFVAKYMGDGVLAYFGYPQAHEDDAERAIQAGLAITAAAPRIATPHGEPVSVRVGVATGVVVVGELIGAGSSEERQVVGETPNLAARLQGVAGPNRVVVSQTTRRLAAGLFDFRDLGALDLKGLGAEAAGWEVLGPAAAADRFRAPRDLGPTPLVNRVKEVERILEAWRAARAGSGQVVGVTGEPGIGKSRLVYEIGKETARQPHVWLEGGGAQIFRNTPFYAVAQMIRRRLGRFRRLSGPEYLERLAQSLAAAGMADGAALPLIAELIDVDTPEGAAPLALGPDARRDALLATLTEWLLKTAERWPLVLVVEDLHWVDPSTLELLDRVVDRIADSRLMLLYTSRDGDHPPWPIGPRHVRLPLQRLDGDDSRRLVTAAAHRDLPREAVDTAIARSGGVPLFAEELARLMGERGAPAERTIPSTLSDLLMARLDQLGPAKRVAQVAAVLGAEFEAPLLRTVAGLNEAELTTALDNLAAADVLVARGGRGARAYAFKHSLIQDAAYEALLKRQRRELHRRAASAIAESSPQTIVAQPEVLAQHWSGAGEQALALEAWREAGRSATRRRAYKEAQRAYEQALAIVVALPASRRRDDLELEVQSSLAGVRQITRGYSAPETIAAAGRARALAEAGGNLSRQIDQLASRWMALSSAGDYAEAGRFANQLLLLAQADGSAEQLGGAYMMQMTTRLRTGDLIGANEAFSQGTPYFASPRFCQRPGAAAQTFGNAARIAWMLDDGVEAARRMARGLAISRNNANPYDLAFALYMTAIQAVLGGRPAEGESLARESMELCDAHGFPQFAGIARIVLGRALAGLEQPPAGVELIREGLAGLTATGARVGITMYFAWLAEAHMLAGEADAALEALDEAIAINPQELTFRPEILRLRGELKLGLGLRETAIADFWEAMALAKTMGARLFHQRAAASLERASA